jgi:tRNA-splicing ligase RtcB
MIDIHHNYASIEEHFGKQVLVHRKGAVKAEKGDFGVIPGSMGTHSYIVVGLGEAESFNSSAHGAGRRLGRHQARRTIPVERVFREMEEKGIKVSTASRHELPEECDAAYKNIDQVMEFQQDLVKIVTVLKPMGVVKG